MKFRTRPRTLRVGAMCGSCALASMWMSGTALAQAPAAPAKPPAPAAAPATPTPATPPPATPAPAPAAAAPAPAAAAPAEAAPAPAPVEPTPAPATEPAPPPPPAAEAPPAEAPKPEEKKLPSIDVGGWLRVGLTFGGITDPKKINDQYLDTAYGELHASGKVHEMVGWTLNLNANALAQTANLMDAIIELDFADQFHLWSGQLLVPVDRTNFSGPFFISPWTYPGIFNVGGNSGTTAFATPAEGPSGRSAGAVAWGDFDKGLFKYYLGMMDLGNLPGGATQATGSPLFSGRLNFSPIGKEPGYYSSSTYYGTKDVLAVGLGAQYKHNGSTSPTAGVAPDNFTDINADLLAEFGLGPNSGTLTGEAAYYHFGGDNQTTDNMFFLVGSYLSPKFGPGALQPMVRYQRAWKDETKWSQIEGHVAYVVDGARLRGLVGFRHTDLGGGVEGNAIEIGLQTIQF